MLIDQITPDGQVTTDPQLRSFAVGQAGPSSSPIFLGPTIVNFDYELNIGSTTLYDNDGI